LPSRSCCGAGGGARWSSREANWSNIMKPRHKRLALIFGGLAALGIAAALVLNAFQSNLVFFFSPTQVIAGEAPVDRSFRVGGVVEPGSIKRAGGLEVHFIVTDTAHLIPVVYAGILPDLFREGKGVVAQGKIGADGVFRASEVLAKHDENYMPREAQHALDEAQKTLNMKTN
jgi:cytochrome c-type biogenesis protein CcmE